MVVYGVEGFGKTTLGANAPKPVIFAARDETGVQALVDAGLIENTPVVDCPTWEATLANLAAFAADTQGRETIVLDTLGAFERLCHEHVCARDYKGEWGDKGFGSFQKGFDVAVAEWMKLLGRLDQLKDKGIVVVVLGHADVKPFKNPSGPDFDQYQCRCHHKTWGATAGWADIVLFGKFESIVEVNRTTGNIAKDKGKGIGGTDRVIYTDRRDAFIAKNRYGMPPEIPLSNDRTQSWAEVWQHIDSNPSSRT